MPVLYLELAIGQHLRSGCVGVWNRVHPFIGGLGIASAVTSFLVAIYYNAIIMWCFFYLFHSFQTTLPWSECPTYVNEHNKTLNIEECDISGPTSYFWYRSALDISPGIDQPDGIKWKLLLCHVCAWIVIFLCICKGIKSSGKVVYFTATFPYVVLIIFFIRGITLEGSVDGLVHMFTPKIEELLDVSCWLDAAAQIFFSFGLAFGGLIAFSSYNPVHNNMERGHRHRAATNWCTAIFACAVIFAVIGFKATVMYNHCIDYNIGILGEICSNLNVSDVMCYGHNSSETITNRVYKEMFEDNLTAFTNFTTRPFRACSLEDDLNKGVEGTGLAFIIFTQAINEFGPSAPFWSVVFFLMLLSLGLGSEFGTIEGVTTSLYDLDIYPWMRKKWLVSGMLCTSMCLVGMLFVTGSGSYWVALFDTFAGTFPLIMVALGECLAVGWILGANRFSEEIECMIGHKPNIYWRVAWKFLAPLFMVALLLGTLIKMFSSPITYKAYNSVTTLMEKECYPWYASVACGVLVFASVLWIPGIALLRKCGVLQYDHAKKLASDIHRATVSTTKFLGGSQWSARSDDRDSGHNSDEDTPLREPERPTEFFIEDLLAVLPARPKSNRESIV
ncbi:sodium-dependent neutral amino acid transporter B(0)AT1-like [Physella acuta]|uniref:sodium-dependent neutral amino acid transporter B(0)AT1-like n=1 Tax=Physella acuta TaxID=109671 RepID=UPI0027DAF00E|nr:sodium-dependent neutral amino acid transporter B(0)AT1-like [Physella acuta]